MDQPDKILKPFNFNRLKVHASHDGPTDHTLCHLQHVHVIVHETETVEWVKHLVTNQPCVSNTFKDAAQLNNITDLL